VKILLPVDGSENSLRAARYVLNMAQKHPSLEITLLTAACDFNDVYFTEAYVDTQDANRRCLDAAKKDLARVKKLFDEAGVPVETEILAGDPGNIIVSYAQEKGVDKVVMGSRGLNPLMGMVLGSVAYKVLHGVKVPVTIIK